VSQKRPLGLQFLLLTGTKANVRVRGYSLRMVKLMSMVKLMLMIILIVKIVFRLMVKLMLRKIKPDANDDDARKNQLTAFIAMIGKPSFI
jgi:hypothetical protein